jgi:hypothetical protein
MTGLVDAANGTPASQRSGGMTSFHSSMTARTLFGSAAVSACKCLFS